jgi:acyl-coenzyme A thioesterase PaaI-like protein
MPFIQDLYPDDTAHCHGCGRLNPQGLHIRSEWRDGETVAHFTPSAHHIALPGYVYGGLLASLVDCHSNAASAAAALDAAGGRLGHDPIPRFVTGSLQVDYLKPTPMGVELVLRSRAEHIGPRKVVVATSVMAGDVEVVRGRVTSVRMPATMAASGS